MDFLLVSPSPSEDPLAARQAYRLHRELSRQGLASQLLYHGLSNPPLSVLNPEQLQGVHLALVEDPSQVHWLIESLGCRARVGMAVGARSFPLLPPDLPYRWLYCLRVEQARRWVEDDCQPGWEAIQQQLQHWRGFTAPRVGWESTALYAARLVLVSQPRLIEILASLYPRLLGKIHRSPLWLSRLTEGEARPFLSLRRPWQQRDLDLLLLATGDDERERRLGRKILSGLPKHRIEHWRGPGEVPWELLGRTRVVVAAARFDWYQADLERAQSMGCRRVTSLNVMNGEQAGPEGLVRGWTAEAFLDLAEQQLKAGPPSPGIWPEPEPIRELSELCQAMPWPR